MLLAILPVDAAFSKYARSLVARTSDNEGPNILDTLKVVAIILYGKAKNLIYSYDYE